MTLLRSAEGIASAAGSDRLTAHVIERRALSLRMTGRAGEAIPLLQSAVRALERSGEASALSHARCRARRGPGAARPLAGSVQCAQDRD